MLAIVVTTARIVNLIDLNLLYKYRNADMTNKHLHQQAKLYRIDNIFFYLAIYCKILLGFATLV